MRLEGPSLGYQKKIRDEFEHQKYLQEVYKKREAHDKEIKSNK